jgi:hypothetical protein
MAGVLIEDDAEGWFESGPVCDMLLKGNRFIGCSIEITPHTETPAVPVHENIRIENNYFDGGGVSAHSVGGLSVTGNRFSGAKLISAPNCRDVNVENNTTNAKESQRER